MRLEDTVKTLDQMTDEELMDRLRAIRHNREVLRPAAAKRTQRAEAKDSRGRLAKIELLLSSLSEADRESLMRQLEIDNERAS